MTEPSDTTVLKCRGCGNIKTVSTSTIKGEISRLQIANFEILTCPMCQRKYSLDDFRQALNRTFTTEDINKAISETQFASKSISYQNIENIQPNIELLKNLKKEAEAKEEIELAKNKKREQEIQKMQSGQKYNEEIVGKIDMEHGSPKDRNCVIILKKEAELYAKTYMALSVVAIAIVTFCVYVISLIFKCYDFIIEQLKRINWCIACSIARITYFIGYIGLIIYTIISSILLKPIFEPLYIMSITPQTPQYSWVPWNITIVLILGLPLLFQLGWAFADKKSRWAKVIQNRMDELIK